MRNIKRKNRQNTPKPDVGRGREMPRTRRRRGFSGIFASLFSSPYVEQPQAPPEPKIVIGTRRSMDRPGYEKLRGEWVRTNSSLQRERERKRALAIHKLTESTVGSQPNVSDTLNRANESEQLSPSPPPPPPPPQPPRPLEERKALMAELGATVITNEGQSQRPLSQRQALNVMPFSQAALAYPPLAGIQHPFACSVRIYQRLAKQVVELQTSQQPDSTVGVMLPESERRVRFVHLSDTHQHHDDVTNVPTGDVLIHSGDLVGNYGRCDNRAMLRQLRDSLLYISELSNRFEAVFILAGNHDTMLDRQQYPKSFTGPAHEMIKNLPSNVTYLDAEANPEQIVHYRGLSIYGCPVNVSRFETMGAHYYSNGFERKVLERREAFGHIPAHLDILLTHTPPLGTSNPHGCAELRKRLKELSKRGEAPRVHCFGHDHSSFGLRLNKVTGTLEVNAAQEDLRRQEKQIGVSGACALTFDVLAPM